MEKFRVEYSAGESRYSSGEGIDYMMVEIDDIELYAELKNPTWDSEKEELADETATYDELKKEIINQAIENDIDPSRLEFWYDDEEG